MTPAVGGLAGVPGSHTDASKAQLKAEARVPYIHGPQEDSNPIIDYIIKRHKYRHGAGKARRP